MNLELIKEEIIKKMDILISLSLKRPLEIEIWEAICWPDNESSPIENTFINLENNKLMIWSTKRVKEKLMEYIPTKTSSHFEQVKLNLLSKMPNLLERVSSLPTLMDKNGIEVEYGDKILKYDKKTRLMPEVCFTASMYYSAIPMVGISAAINHGIIKAEWTESL